MSTPVKGKYWQVLPETETAGYGGNFDAMPNNSREDIGKVEFFAECTVTILEDGIELELSARGIDFLFTQLVCMLNRDGEIIGDDISKMNEWVVRQNFGRCIYSRNNSTIEFEGCGAEHDIDVIRGDTLNKEAINLVFNMVSPDKKKIIIRSK